MHEKLREDQRVARGKEALTADGRGSFNAKKRSWDGYLLFTDDKKGIERTLEEEITKQPSVGAFFETG